MMVTLSPRDRNGFTLIEVTAALVIFTLGVLAVGRLSSSLAGQMEAAALRSEVVTAAQERMEEMQRIPYDTLSVGTTTESLTFRGAEYTRTTRITGFAIRTFSVEVVVEPTDTVGALPDHRLLSYVYEEW